MALWKIWYNIGYGREEELTPLAERILAGEFEPGDEVRVEVDGGELRFSHAA